MRRESQHNFLLPLKTLVNIPASGVSWLKRIIGGLTMDNILEEEIERLRAENALLKREKKHTDIHFKVSQKGAVSAYGLGRFPVTLYKEQWFRLLDKKESLLDFIRENDSQLKTKN